MILTCPSCGTQYAVKDGAIPPDGRQVRCAACKHSWHQNPEGEGEATQALVEESQSEVEPSEADADESLTEATLIEPRSGPDAEERAYESTFSNGDDATTDSPAPEVEQSSAAPVEQAPTEVEELEQPEQIQPQDDEFTFFPTPDETLAHKRSPLVAILIIILVVIVLAAAFWFLAPTDLKARLGLGGIGTTPLALVTTHMDRQRLASGNELLTVTGRVINPTPKEQYVPALQAQLKTKAGKIVYSWTIAPPAHSLPPGSSASFNSTEVNVPPGGDELTLTVGSAPA